MSSKRFPYKITHKEYSRRRFLLSIIIGVLTSFIFYFFLQYLFVLLRNINLGFLYNSNDVLKTDIRNYIVLFFSSISVIVGNSIGIAFLFSSPSKSTYSRKARRQLLNDQSALTPTALYWLLKIAVFYIGSTIISHSLYFFKEYFYAIPLLILVLFLDQVKNLRRFFKGYSILKMCIHAFTLGLLSFFITFININIYDVQGDYQKSNGLFVELPKFKIDRDYDEKIFTYNHQNQIRFKVTEVNDSIHIFGWDKFLSYHDMQISIMESDRSHYRQDAIFYIDKSVRWNKLKPLFKQLQLINTQKAFIVITDSKSLWNVYYKHYIITTKEQYYKWESSKDIPPPPPPPPFFEDYTRGKNIDTLTIGSFKESKTSIKDSIHSYIYDNAYESTAYILNIDNDITVNDYLEFMISYKMAIYKLRKRYNNHPHLRDSTSAIQKFPIEYKETILKN